MNRYQPAQQTLQLNEFRLFYQPPNDNNFYHVNFKMILEFSENWDYSYYDYDFFYEGLDANYYVTCKLLPPSLIISILNKEFYEIDFDLNDLKRKHTLTWGQKYNLELSLKQDLPFLQEKILKSDFSNTSIDQILIQSSQQANELRLFHQPPNDDFIYNVACKITLQNYNQNDYDDYDYEFFYQISNDIINTKHIKCKILSPPSVIGLLNKKIYGIDFDINDLKRKHVLAWYQKLNLELSLKRFFLQIPESEMGLKSNVRQTVSITDGQSYFDNTMLPRDDQSQF
ncbi:uncharacterized protein OCT59_006906 [Rhizophagus irregularis]|uniref:Uncharacterized protein n=2 Tax=Rhizophagus irregularis TaxID=588596 RepID=A0A015LPI6_RHIIW|nr:hypothetical protein GLOIN_2v1836766 [Rhizophagus irregularis DAOM 181602=DAOM 197198]EXX74641.1 hypothetical protein RirG_049240 [Rhizophagus irregularis DAOM 197198w]UZO15486.1 hypothetical protein OCT59_006906 [Rhizophagus irregularis]POG78566.1 hypothetical protein GLOIN_2v1836766 [Rhizophagus irregularis DAOM 181602=DAOM 197198]CAG8581573.1 5347_t:CDS:2 [Rhizophagus irregularis]GBC32525.1 hypothetical protein GLOIN_2v1836766 [Rhizophagus irregularis DAOM 181602=DAOM 197198]|eukprot:XP_025185432.1 hypothetical protein GLOIN_2v1836766 [Rhizophagus irregularis DAOM 181602=DAOM 197198]